MHRSFLALPGVAALSLSLIPCACRSASPSADGARLYEGYGGYHRTITTSSPEAQRWFDQGLQLLYGFNHDEAIRSFRRAAELDPAAPMPWWGVAYGNGLDINNPEVTEEASRDAWEATQAALARLDGATPVERALVRAVEQRYAWPPPEDRRPLDEAFAAAMEQVWADFPDDPDVGAIYAESLMNLQPWDLWTHAGEPKGRTLEIVAVLERCIALDPDHPGANHFYIHTVEASNSPERAIPAAATLTDLVPGSGHLVHMPSHIWIRTGRYAEAADANARAIEADRAYFAVAPPPDFYSLYYIHNIHFLAYAAMMEGRYETALDASRRIAREVPPEFVEHYTKLADGLMPVPLHVMIRFGRWEDILREPAPADFQLMSRAIRHYARAVACANTERPGEGHAELAAFDEVAAQMDDTWLVGNNSGPTVLAIARAMAEGEVLFKEGRRADGLASLREAVRLEDQLVYDEPPGWMQPVRHALGALLLVDGRAKEAEAVYRADLERHPENGWSLTGLREALARQDKAIDAAELEPRIAAAWSRSDAQPAFSCFCAQGAPRP